MTNTYIKCFWYHSYPDCPTLIYSELDEERWEIRKVEVFSDGSKGFAPGMELGKSELGKVAIPPNEEISRDPQFQCLEISQKEFEEAWNGR